MKNLLFTIFLLLCNTFSYAQSSFGSASFSKPTLGGVNYEYYTPTSAQIVFYVTENGGAAINEWVLYFDQNNPPSTIVLQSPLNNTIYSYLPIRLFDFQTGLTSGATYYAKYCVSNIAGQTCSGVYPITLPMAYPPSVTTNAATSIGTTTATINGNITSQGDAAITDRGFYYGLSNPPLSKSSEGSTGTGAYSLGLGGLQSNTAYYFRAYATNTYGESVGDILSFTTQSTGTTPTVTTTPAYNITTGGALSGGNVISDGGATVTERGVEYGTTSGVYTNYSAGASGLGSFTVSLSYLASSTTYYYRAYATNSYGTAYGTEYSFTTLSQTQLPVVTTTIGSNITEHSFNSGGNITSQGSSSVTSRGIVVSTTVNPTLEDRLFQTSDGSGTGSFVSFLDDLICGTTYYVRAYATNSSGTAYGSDVTITTENTEPQAYVGLLFKVVQNSITYTANDEASAIILCEKANDEISGTNSSYGYFTTSIEIGSHIHFTGLCKVDKNRTGWYAARFNNIFTPVYVTNGIITYVGSQCYP